MVCSAKSLAVASNEPHRLGIDFDRERDSCRLRFIAVLTPVLGMTRTLILAAIATVDYIKRPRKRDSVNYTPAGSGIVHYAHPKRPG